MQGLQSRLREIYVVLLFWGILSVGVHKILLEAPIILFGLDGDEI